MSIIYDSKYESLVQNLFTEKKDLSRLIEEMPKILYKMLQAEKQNQINLTRKKIYLSGTTVHIKNGAKGKYYYYLVKYNNYMESKRGFKKAIHISSSKNRPKYSESKIRKYAHDWEVIHISWAVNKLESNLEQLNIISQILNLLDMLRTEKEDIVLIDNLFNK